MKKYLLIDHIKNEKEEEMMDEKKK